jgi:hypothetical protein
LPLRKGERFDLADLLTGIGSAMGASNERLRVTGAPSLLREFTMEVRFQACVSVAPDQSTVWFRTAASRLPQPPVLSPGAQPNVRLKATYIAAPALRPVTPT